jgi:hypothetical protein
MKIKDRQRPDNYRDTLPGVIPAYRQAGLPIGRQARTISPDGYRERAYPPAGGSEWEGDPRRYCPGVLLLPLQGRELTAKKSPTWL